MTDTDNTAPSGDMQPADAGSSAGMQKAPLNRVWFIKIGIMVVALLAFAGWGLYDALVAYPARGARYAEHAEWKYLVALDAARTEEARYLENRAVVEDPKAELARLEADDEKNRNLLDSSDPSSRRNKRATAQIARMMWLDGLKTIGRLSPEYTDFVGEADEKARTPAYTTARERLGQLGEKWSTAPQPKPLAFYDIPSQWLIVAVCAPLGLWLLILFVRVILTTYKWDPSARKIGMPNGAWIGASDLDEVDKSKWDKFIVFLKIKQGHDKVGGQTLKLDLYRHAKLEDWVLALEEEAFGSEQSDEEQKSGDSKDGPEEGGETPEPAASAD